jgi:hypothetical protein
MNVLAVIITKDDVEPACLAALRSQVPAIPWLIRGAHPNPAYDAYPGAARVYANCAENREAARRLALASDADAFLYLDSDIVLPAGAVAEFVRQSRPNRILGGWYPILGTDRWVAGRWVADNVFHNFTAPQPGVVRTDTVGLGCAFLPRAAMERLPIRHGADLECRDVRGRQLMVGECGAFGNDAAAAGFRLYMVGEVVCGHVRRSGAPGGFFRWDSSQTSPS